MITPKSGDYVDHNTIHELTMLYLKQNTNGLSVSQIAQKYIDTYKEFKKAFAEQQGNPTICV